MRSQTQDGQTNVWGLDPARRQRANSGAADGSSERLHYADASDSPAWSETLDSAGAQTGWSHNVAGIGGELAATVTDTGQGPTVALQLANLRGDIVASASTDPAAGAPTARYTNDEFGNPQGAARPARYGFLGAKNRRTTLPTSGIVQMGVRTYIPNLGRFTTTDPVTGGSANNYDYTNQDPINQYDLDGFESRFDSGGCFGFTVGPLEYQPKGQRRRVGGRANVFCAGKNVLINLRVRLELFFIRIRRGKLHTGWKSVKRTDFTYRYKSGGAPSIPVNMRCRAGVYRISYRLNVWSQGRQVVRDLLRRSSPAVIDC